jgi:hypothetical protein
MEPYTSGFLTNNEEKEVESRVNCGHNSLYHTVCTSDSLMEMVPEFYFLPEIYTNRNNIHLGMPSAAQDENGFYYKEMNDSWMIAPFAMNSWDYVRIFREELESHYVTQNLYKWIDMTFGICQRDPDKFNVYHAHAYAELHEKYNWDTLRPTDDEWSFAKLSVQNVLAEMGTMPNKLFDSSTK